MTSMLTALTLVLALSSVAADPSGKWKASVQGPDGGTMDIEFTFKTDGEALTGSVSGPMGEAPITKGSVKGDQLTFTVSAGEMGDLPHTASVSGDEMAITVDIGGNVYDYVARRTAP